MTKIANEKLVASRPVLKGSTHVDRNIIGRPPAEYTPGLRDSICNLIKQGQRPHVAAQISGINKTTFERWMRAGRSGDPFLWEFSDAVEQAVAIFEGKMVDTLTAENEDGVIDASNAKFVLERRFPDGYSKELDAKVRALLDDFKKNLITCLPETITEDMVGLNLLELVVAAGNGERYVPTNKGGFELKPLNGSDEESIDEQSSESDGTNVPGDEERDQVEDIDET